MYPEGIARNAKNTKNTKRPTIGTTWGDPDAPRLCKLTQQSHLYPKPASALEEFVIAGDSLLESGGGWSPAKREIANKEEL